MNKEKKLNIQTLLRKIDSSTRKHMMSRENLSHMPSERDALRHARSQGRLDFLFKDKVLINNILSKQRQYSDKDIFRNLYVQIEKIIDEKN